MYLKNSYLTKYFWLNWLMDDSHLGYCPKKKPGMYLSDIGLKRFMKSNPWGRFFCFQIQQVYR